MRKQKKLEVKLDGGEMLELGYAEACKFIFLKMESIRKSKNETLEEFLGKNGGLDISICTFHRIKDIATGNSSYTRRYGKPTIKCLTKISKKIGIIMQEDTVLLLVKEQV